MRQRRETPQPWSGAMERAGIASLNELSRRSGIAVETLTRLVHAEGRHSARTLDAVAAQLLPADARKVPAWAGAEWRSSPVLPDVARKLTPKQWRAVERLIESIVEPGDANTQEGVDSGNKPTPLTERRAAHGRSKSTTKRQEPGER